MASLKIGVLTFHRCINYGSYWQARCLAEGLINRGHKATILDHDSGRINLAEWKCAYRPVLPTPVPESDFPLYRQKIERFFQCFESLPLSPRFPLEHPEEMEPIDIAVVGSDEVFNLAHPWFGHQPIFYGEGLKAKQVISYAASFGNYDASWGLDPVWADKLQNFSHISVRDANSRTIIRNATGLDPVTVLDPCLQFPIEPDERSTVYFDKPYIAVYGHNFTKDYIEKIRKIAAAKNLPLISIGYRNDWADEQWLTADPHDFVHFIKNANAVATNFFHGCVFSIRYARPFVCETSSYRSIKVQGLMHKLGGEKHLVNEETADSIFFELMEQPVDQQMLHRIQSLRQTSNNFLDEALVLSQLQVA